MPFLYSHLELRLKDLQSQMCYGHCQKSYWSPLFGAVSRTLRFGNPGTCVAIDRDQFENHHLDWNDNNAFYTSIMVLGDETKSRNSSHYQGSLYLSTLGIVLPMNNGDMVFFNALELPHFVIKLDAAEREYGQGSPPPSVTRIFPKFWRIGRFGLMHEIFDLDTHLPQTSM